MKKKDEIILEIADVNFPNKAYGYYEGEKVIVKNAVHRCSKNGAAAWRRACRRSSNALRWKEKQECVPIMHFAAAAPIRPCGMRRSLDSRSDR